MISRLLRPRTSAERSVEDKRRRLWSSLADDRDLAPARVHEIECKSAKKKKKKFSLFLALTCRVGLVQRFSLPTTERHRWQMLILHLNVFDHILPLIAMPPRKHTP